MNEITTSELAALGSTATIIDVREQNEWDEGRIGGSTLIPMSQFVDRLGELPTGDTLYILCRSGARSGRVTEYLEQQGIDAVNVAGGIMAWQADGRRIETD